MSYVLDTNIVVAALNGHSRVVRRLNAIPSRQALLPAMALAELRFGEIKATLRQAGITKSDADLGFPPKLKIPHLLSPACLGSS